MLPVRVPRGPGAAPAPARWPGTEAGPSKVCGHPGPPGLRSVPLALRRRSRLVRGCGVPGVRPVRCAAGPAPSGPPWPCRRPVPARPSGAAWPPLCGLWGWWAGLRHGLWWVVPPRGSRPGLAGWPWACALGFPPSGPGPSFATGGPPAAPGPGPGSGPRYGGPPGAMRGPGFGPSGALPSVLPPGAGRPWRAAFPAPGPGRAPAGARSKERKTIPLPWAFRGPLTLGPQRARIFVRL